MHWHWHWHAHAHPRSGGRRHRRWWARLLIGLAIALATVVLVAAGLVAIVLTTPAGTRWALRHGVAFYDGRIPGHVSFEDTDGAIASGLCIRGLRLADGQDHALLTAEAVCVRPRLWSLVGRHVEVEQLSVEGAALHLWPEGNWGDLAPPSPDEPKDELPGPDLPVRITAPITIDRFDVIGHGETVGEAVDVDDRDSTEPVVRGAWLYARLEAEGRKASVVVDSVGGEIPVTSTTIEDGTLAVRWSSPALVLERLELRSSYGRVEAARGRLHAMPGALQYGAELRAIAFVPMKEGQPPLRVPAEVRLEGTDRIATASGRVVAPTLARAEISALVDLYGTTRMTAFVHAEPDPRLRLPSVHAWLTARAPGEDPLQARLMALAPGVVLAATWDGAEANARGYVDGARVDASVRLEDGKVRRLEARVDVASAARATAAIDRLVPAEVPTVQGAGRVSAVCRVDEAWACGLQAAVQQGGDRLETTVEIEAGGETIEVQLQRLVGRLRGEPVRLAAPVHATVRDTSVSITPLRLAVAGGTIEAEGRVAWEGASDLEARLANLDLGVVPRFVPSVPIAGRLGGTLTAQGDLERPRVHATIGAIDLRWGRERLGQVRVEAGYDAHGATADVRWQRDRTQLLVRADVPLSIDPERGGIVWREHAPVEASVELKALALADVARLVGGPAIAGRVDATVHAHGRMREPIVELELTGSDLRFEDHAIGRAHVSAAAREQSVTASVDVHGPMTDEVHVEATVPLALRPTQGGVDYRERDRHELSARIVGVDLDDLEPYLGENAPDLAGLVRAEAHATAEAGKVQAKLDVLGRDLVVVGYELGVTRVTAELVDDRASARVVVSNGWARYAGVEASVPLALDGPFGTPRMSPTAPISAHLELVDVDLGGIGRFGPGPAIGGELEGTIDVSGTLRQPTLTGELTVDGLTHGSKRLGQVRIRTGYDGKELVAKVEQEYGAARASAWGRVPLGVDLATPKIAWHRERPHRLSVHVKGLNEDVVGLLVELPDDLRFDAAGRLEARGTVKDPRAVLRVRASVDPGGNALPVPIAVQLDVEPDQQDARVMMGDQGREGLVIEAHTNASLPELIAGRGDPKAIEIDAVARAEGFDLRELAPLLPESLHDPRGRLTLHATARGPITGPHMKGSIALQDGALTVVPMRQQFEDIELRARMDGPDIVLETLRARSAEGTASATASLHLEPGKTRGEATVTARKLPLVRPGLPAMRLDLRVRAEIDATGDVTSVALRADQGFLDVLEVSPMAAADPIPEDDDVVYVDAQGLAAQRKQAKREAKADAKEPWLPQDMAFSLVLEEPLRVRGPQADMDWTGRFALTRRPEMPPHATGMLRTQGGRVSMLNHDFDIETATIRFPEEGDLDPFVDLVATTETPEATVTMLIRGRASRPQLILRSEPPMPESDVFALLITGRADADEADDKEFSAKAAGVLAAVNSPALQRHLRERVGVDRVGLGFGESVDQPIVTVGKRVNDKLYVEAGYHHNAPRGVNEAEVRLEYRFAPPRWSVETFFGDAAQGGVGLWWQRRFMTRGQRAALRARKEGASPAAGPVSETQPDAGAPGASPSSGSGGGSPR